MLSIIEQLLYHTDKSSHWRCSIKKAVHNNCNFHRNHLCWSLFWDQVEVKLQAIRPATLLKRDSNTDVFLWILQNFYEQVFEEHLHMAASENNNKKRFLGTAISHKDHYMINVGGQRPKIGSSWPLTGPYLQRWHQLPRVQIIASQFRNCKVNVNVCEIKLSKDNKNMKQNC